MLDLLKSFKIQKRKLEQIAFMQKLKQKQIILLKKQIKLKKLKKKKTNKQINNKEIRKNDYI